MAFLAIIASQLLQLMCMPQTLPKIIQEPIVPLQYTRGWDASLLVWAVGRMLLIPALIRTPRHLYAPSIGQPYTMCGLPPLVRMVLNAMLLLISLCMLILERWG